MKSARILGVVAVVLALAFVATGCSSNKGVAAKVNGEKIMIAAVNEQVDQIKKQYPTMFTGTDGEGRLLDYKQRVLDNLINKALVEQAAKGEGVNVTDADVQARLKALKDQFKDKGAFQQALTSAGMTEATLAQNLREQMVREKIIAKISKDIAAPTEAEIKAYYDANKPMFQVAAATRASHIVFAAADKAKAEKVLAQIRSGADFATMAKQSSIDTGTASNGGDLGYPTTPYLAEFAAALNKLKVGQVSGLVQTANGWEIIKATESRKASTKTLAEAKAQIEQILVQQQKADAYQKYILDLRKKAKIEILLPELKATQGSTNTTSSK